MNDTGQNLETVCITWKYENRTSEAVLAKCGKNTYGCVIGDNWTEIVAVEPKYHESYLEFRTLGHEMWHSFTGSNNDGWHGNGYKDGRIEVTK